MPRFIARPVIVEAFQFMGGTALFPDDFRRAILRHLPGGITEVATGEGPRAMKYGDWLLKGADGTFQVRPAGSFDTWFEIHVPETAPPPVASKVAGKIKEKLNG